MSSTNSIVLRSPSSICSTIEPRPARAAWARSLKYLGGAAGALAAWFFICLAFSLSAPAGRSLAVLAPAEVVGVAGGFLLRQAGPLLIVRSDDADFARRLYAAGALLVLDVEDAGGCTGRPRPTKVAARL